MAKHCYKDFERNLNHTPYSKEEFAEILAPWSAKLTRFLSTGYRPHKYQYLAHCSNKRYTVMGAGRRGGKSVSAGYEAAAMATPGLQEDILRRKGVDVVEGKVIIGAIVMPDKQNYSATYRLFFEALDKIAGPEGVGYEYNRNKNEVYLPNRKEAKSIVHFKSADQPHKLRGEGYSWTWWDEPGFIKGNEAWNSFEPALQDHVGCGIFSTTPGNEDEHWWFFDEFINQETLTDEIDYIEWFSIENPFFKEKEWKKLKKKKHPFEFRREYMAQWDRGGGKVLKLNWLSKWQFDIEPWDEEKKTGFHYLAGGLDRSRYWIVSGVDVAISEKQHADYTVIAVLAIDKVTGVAYLIDMIRDRIDFPSQIDAVNYIQAKWKPDIMGIEAVGYQRALQQQTQRGIMTGPIVPMEAKGTKYERIVTASVSFRNGQVRVPRPDHIDDEQLASAILAFWKEWAEFSHDDTHNHDDTLDAVEIALRVFPMIPGVEIHIETVHTNNQIPVSKAELLHREISSQNNNVEGWDEAMGSDW